MLINIHDAKTHFSKYIEKALKGDEIIIAKGGKPLVRLVPYCEEPESRKGGQFKGLIQISDNFNDALPEEILKLFYHEEK